MQTTEALHKLIKDSLHKITMLEYDSKIVTIKLNCEVDRAVSAILELEIPAREVNFSSKLIDILGFDPLLQTTIQSIFKKAWPNYSSRDTNNRSFDKHKERPALYSISTSPFGFLDRTNSAKVIDSSILVIDYWINNGVGVDNLTERTAMLIIAKGASTKRFTEAVNLINILGCNPALQEKMILLFESKTQYFFYNLDGKYKASRQCKPPTPKPKTQQVVSRSETNETPEGWVDSKAIHHEGHMDATKDYYDMYRDNGRFGSHPSHDGFDDESDP